MFTSEVPSQSTSEDVKAYETMIYIQSTILLVTGLAYCFAGAKIYPIMQGIIGWITAFSITNMFFQLFASDSVARILGILVGAVVGAGCC